MKVHQHSSTKEFIKSSFVLAKKHNPSLNVERYAKRLGLGVSTLKMILSGKRRPTVYQTLSVARDLRLSSGEIAYLEALSLHEAAKDSWQKAYYAKLLAAKKKDVKVSTIHTSQKKLLSDPIILPLLVYLMGRKPEEIDYFKLAKELRVSEKRVIELVNYFKANEILLSQSEGQHHVAFDKLSHRVVQKNYQKSLLTDVAGRIDTEYDNPTSLFLSYTFSATEEMLLQLQIDLKNIMTKYMAEDVRNESKIQIAQACFQVLPVIR
jgi:transcriptional regulator with XRE-family HTH domain